MKPETAQQEEKIRNHAFLVKLIITICYFQLISRVLWKYLGLPDPLAVAISGTAVFLPAYWVPARPDVSFSRYAVLIEALVAAYAIVLSSPDLLRPYMPIQLAVTLPLLALSLPFYYLLRKLAPPSTRRRVSLGKWVIGSLALAIVLAGVTTLLPQ